jgi:hypothetical protein
MKKVILTILSIIAFVILISEPDILTLGIIGIKIIALLYLWLVAKANNYFYQGE